MNRTQQYRYQRKIILECFHDEVDAVQQDYNDGRISATYYNRYMRNLNNGVEIDLAELDREYGITK